jgi:hypothetical protein
MHPDTQHDIRAPKPKCVHQPTPQPKPHTHTTTDQHAQPALTRREQRPYITTTFTIIHIITTIYYIATASVPFTTRTTYATVFPFPGLDFSLGNLLGLLVSVLDAVALP